MPLSSSGYESGLYLKCRSLFWQGDFDQAALVAQRALAAGDDRARLVLAREALSRSDHAQAVSHSEMLLRSRILARDASRVLWAAAKASQQLVFLRRASIALPMQS